MTEFSINTENNNIKTYYVDGHIKYYVTESTNDLKLPSCQFDTFEDANLFVAMVRAMNKRGNKNNADYLSNIKYIFRILGFNDSPWVE